MTSLSFFQAGDPGSKGWRAELARARAQPELHDVAANTEAARRAAYWLAVVLGNCRLRDVDLGKDDGTLPVAVAFAAGRRLRSLLQVWAQNAWNLEQRLTTADDPVEANELCFDLLEARMEAWAAFVAIDEAYQACLTAPSPQCADFGDLIDKLLDALDELDLQMQEQLDLLSQVAHYPLLENWKKAVGPTYSQVLPWWLDGRLQAEAERVQNGTAWQPRDIQKPVPPPP